MIVDTKREREIGMNAIRDWQCTHGKTIIGLADEVDRLRELLKVSLKQIDFEDWPICPYCGKEDTDVTDLHAALDTGHTGSHSCPSCGRDYVVTIDASYSYSTKEEDEP